mmetsp:Transcript_134182/g.286971  ORF Transcript_134182/g.286971 Transcript_134182/m.286971 type:complete len:206 (+) Transcript_134182:212-829(+)
MHTRFAEDPMIEPMPPQQAPMLRGQIRTLVLTPAMEDFCKSMRTYTIVVVNGKDSKKALPIDETHSMMIMAMAMRESSGKTSISLIMPSPSSRITPSSLNDSTRTKSNAKNRSVPHSTTSRYFSRLCRSNMKAHANIAITQNHAGSMPCTGDNNNAIRIPANTAISLAKTGLSVISFSRANASRSRWEGFLPCKKISLPSLRQRM